MDNRVTVLPVVCRGNWFFRVSVLDDPKNSIYSIMILIWNKRRRDIYVRYFDDEKAAAAFVEDCSAGKFGVILK